MRTNRESSHNYRDNESPKDSWVYRAGEIGGFWRMETWRGRRTPHNEKDEEGFKDSWVYPAGERGGFSRRET